MPRVHDARVRPVDITLLVRVAANLPRLSAGLDLAIHAFGFDIAPEVEAMTSGMFGEERGEASVVRLDRSEPVVYRRALDVTGMRSLAAAIEASAILERELDITGRVDTSDTSVTLVVHGALGARAFRSDVAWAASGYDGPDAPALDALVHHLLGAAGAPLDAWPHWVR